MLPHYSGSPFDLVLSELLRAHCQISQLSPGGGQQEVMRDPVVLLGDSMTYERSAIQQWLGHSLTSPLTGEELQSVALVPNHSLKSVIAHFLQQRQVQRSIAFWWLWLHTGRHCGLGVLPPMSSACCMCRGHCRTLVAAHEDAEMYTQGWIIARQSCGGPVASLKHDAVRSCWAPAASGNQTSPVTRNVRKDWVSRTRHGIWHRWTADGGHVVLSFPGSPWLPSALMLVALGVTSDTDIPHTVTVRDHRAGCLSIQQSECCKEQEESK